MNCQASNFKTELVGLEQEEDFENFLDIIDLKNPNFSRYINETTIDRRSTMLGNKKRWATMTEAEMFLCTCCGKPLRMTPFNSYSLCPFCIAKNEHKAKDEVWSADNKVSS
jgi:hypothetical protein